MHRPSALPLSLSLSLHLLFPSRWCTVLFRFQLGSIWRPRFFSFPFLFFSFSFHPFHSVPSAFLPFPSPPSSLRLFRSLRRPISLLSLLFFFYIYIYIYIYIYKKPRPNKRLDYDWLRVWPVLIFFFFFCTTGARSLRAQPISRKPLFSFRCEFRSEHPRAMNICKSRNVSRKREERETSNLWN